MAAEIAGLRAELDHTVTRQNRPQERTLESWESWVDKAIRDAQERGEFSGLPGEGQPVRIDRNPLAGDQELGFHVLKNADVLPVWMELGRDAANGIADLDAFLERAREQVMQLRRRVCTRSDQRPVRPAPVLVRWLRGGFPEWRSQPDSPTTGSAERERQRLRAQYIERASRVDRRVKSYNDALPDDLRWLERPRLLANDAGARFDALCPPVGCS
jgi:hypothetical protein